MRVDVWALLDSSDPGLPPPSAGPVVGNAMQLLPVAWAIDVKVMVSVIPCGLSAGLAVIVSVMTDVERVTVEICVTVGPEAVIVTCALPPAPKDIVKPSSVIGSLAVTTSGTTLVAAGTVVVPLVKVMVPAVSVTSTRAVDRGEVTVMKLLTVPEEMVVSPMTVDDGRLMVPVICVIASPNSVVAARIVADGRLTVPVI